MLDYIEITVEMKKKNVTFEWECFASILAFFPHSFSG